jgi:transposase
MPQIDIITGESRRRSWTPQEKQAILAAAFAPGAVVTEVARRANVSTGQLYTWRKELMKKKPVEHGGFSRIVTVADLPPAPRPLPPPVAASTVPTPASVPAAKPGAELAVIEVEVRGRKARIPPTMPAALASAVIRALVRR